MCLSTIDHINRLLTLSVITLSGFDGSLIVSHVKYPVTNNVLLFVIIQIEIYRTVHRSYELLFVFDLKWEKSKTDIVLWSDMCMVKHKERNFKSFIFYYGRLLFSMSFVLWICKMFQIQKLISLYYSFFMITRYKNVFLLPFFHSLSFCVSFCVSFRVS